jgi:hypothetical protein
MISHSKVATLWVLLLKLFLYYALSSQSGRFEDEGKKEEERKE